MQSISAGSPKQVMQANSCVIFRHQSVDETIVLKLGNKGSLCPDGTSQQMIGSMLKALSNSAAMELCAYLRAQSMTSNYTTTAASQLCDCCTNAHERGRGGRSCTCRSPQAIAAVGLGGCSKPSWCQDAPSTMCHLHSASRHAA